MSEVLSRFRTNNPESAANESVGHTTPPPLRKEEVFTSLVLVPVFLIYKSKWHFCSAGLIFLGARVTIENRAPRRTGPVRPCRSLKDLFLTASGDKHAGQCHASCSLAVFLTNYKTKLFFESIGHMLGSLVNTAWLHPPSKNSRLHLFLFLFVYV